MALVLLALGLGLRLFDLTDQPLDFHPTRQLRGAIIARGIYYEKLPSADPALRETASEHRYSTGQYEPPLLEHLAAYTYLLLGGEVLWVARLYSSLFWLFGGLALLALAHWMAGGVSTGGLRRAALVALGYYLVLPFAVQASRSFQPDPLMTMWLVLTAYCLYRWSLSLTRLWAILAGVSGGLAILTKAVAVYMVGGAALGAILFTLGVRKAWRSPQAWGMAVLMVAPSASYYLVQNQSRAAEYLTTWTVSLSHLLLEPGFYVRWLSFVQNLVGLTALLLSLVGALLAEPRSRALLLGMWVGYAVYGLTLPYQMYTHNYYHLPLVPLISLSLVPLAAVVIERLRGQAPGWRLLLAGIALVWVIYPAWVSVVDAAREDHRNEPAYWNEIASQLPGEGKILALTQDYGYRLMYYGWRKVSVWPTRGEQELSALRGSPKEFEAFFSKRTQGYQYFLITAFGQLADQPELERALEERFPLLAEGDGYLVYDLAHPLSQ